MPAPDPIPAKSTWWLESLLWSAVIAVAVGIAAYVSETAREVMMQGLAYLFAFMTTPFILEATAAFVGLCVVIAINNRRLEREGDGWVEMEVKQPKPADDDLSVKPETTGKASKI
ncbi:hypothetical protein [Prosthecobacter sp.]|uniref:hypothetical protein n=1 Tax=Prosthecobacter sp. TaxID=1965333 RepID=UPI002AB7F423|nr:hypothetical protein [Prosthecobacter sp.]MDZ4401999.1 hypothetical protein [Prosthecobacter sp.]